MTFRFGRLDSTIADRFKLQQFHNLLFKNTDASLEWFEWYLNRIGLLMDPDIEPRVYCAHDGETLVGIWCVEPKDFSSGGATIKIGRCFSVGTHPDYRRQGLFDDLSRFAIESERQIGDYEYILGFPQIGKPVIEAHLKAGWENVQRIEMYGFKPTKRARKTTLSSVMKIDGEGFNSMGYDWRIWNGTDDPTVSGFLNSADYVDLRWLRHPDHHYVCLATHDASYIVVKPYGSTGHILDIGGTHGGVKYLLESVQTLAYRHRWDELTIWCADNEHFSDAIRETGFSPGADHGLSVELLAVKINATVPLKLERVHFNMGSEEIF